MKELGKSQEHWKDLERRHGDSHCMVTIRFLVGDRSEGTNNRPAETSQYLTGMCAMHSPPGRWKEMASLYNFWSMFLGFLCAPCNIFVATLHRLAPLLASWKAVIPCHLTDLFLSCCNGHHVDGCSWCQNLANGPGLPFSLAYFAGCLRSQRPCKLLTGGRKEHLKWTSDKFMHVNVYIIRIIVYIIYLTTWLMQIRSRAYSLFILYYLVIFWLQLARQRVDSCFHSKVCIAVHGDAISCISSFSKFHDNAVEHGCFLSARISLNTYDQISHMSTVPVFDSRYS